MTILSFIKLKLLEVAIAAVSRNGVRNTKKKKKDQYLQGRDKKERRKCFWIAYIIPNNIRCACRQWVRENVARFEFMQQSVYIAMN